MGGEAAVVPVVEHGKQRAEEPAVAELALLGHGGRAHDEQQSEERV
jgi:hypothetical protein